MTMTVQEMVERLQGLGHMVAQAAAAREDLNLREKCFETSRAFLEILDGKTDHFPKVNLWPSPHRDDVLEAQKNDEAWLDSDISLHDDLAQRFVTLCAVGEDETGWPSRTSGAYTQDEVTLMFLSSMQGSAIYWSTIDQSGNTAKIHTDLECCEGVIFTNFAILDGSNIASPMFDVAPDFDDIAARPAVADFSPIVLDAYFHEGFYQVEAFVPDAKDAAAPAP